MKSIIHHISNDLNMRPIISNNLPVYYQSKVFVPNEMLHNFVAVSFNLGQIVVYMLYIKCIIQNVLELNVELFSFQWFWGCDDLQAGRCGHRPLRVDRKQILHFVQDDSVFAGVFLSIVVSLCIQRAGWLRFL